MQIQENNPQEATLELVISLDRADIERDLARVAVKFSESMGIPGFRKGKAPYDAVIRHAGGEDKIYAEAIEPIVRRTLSHVLQEKKVDLFGQPKISIQNMTPPFGITYKAILPLAPTVELGDIKKISEKKNTVSASGEDVQKVINNLREMRASESAVNRPIQTGDKAVVDFEIKLGGVTIEGGTAVDYSLVVGEGRFIPGFEEKLIGKRVAEQAQFELEFPKEYHAKHLAGKKADFSVTIKQVFERKLPEFNDAFAKGLGHTQTADELKKQITDNLQQEKQREENERFQMACMNTLVRLSKIGQISPAAIDEEVHKMARELENSVVRQGIKFEEYLNNLKKTKEDLEKEFRPKAEERLKLGLVAGEFRSQRKIEADEKEVEREVELSKKAHQNNPQSLARFSSENYKQYVRNVMTNRKTFETLANEVAANST